jgi:hypothetical protein
MKDINFTIKIKNHTFSSFMKSLKRKEKIKRLFL